MNAPIPPCPVHDRPLTLRKRRVVCPNPQFVYSLHGYQCLATTESGTQCKTQHVTPQQHARNVRIIDKVARIARPLVSFRKDA